MSNSQNTHYNESINEYAEEYQAEHIKGLKLLAYHNQLQRVWLKMIKDYPHLYDLNDYFTAYKKIINQ